MRKVRERDLAFWKAEAVSWRNVANKAKAGSTKQYAEYFLRMSRRICEAIEERILVVLLLVLISILASGCQTAKGITGDSGWILTKLSKNIQTEQE